MSITIQHTKECLCVAHIYALGGSAGLNFSARTSFDYGVDGTFRPVNIRQNRRSDTGFFLDYQAKATVRWLLRDDFIVYDLEAKTYNDIVSRTADETTLILILLCLPRNAADWHVTSTDITTLSHACYWYLPDNATPVTNKARKRIFIPIANRLTPATLLELKYLG